MHACIHMNAYAAYAASYLVTGTVLPVSPLEGACVSPPGWRETATGVPGTFSTMSATDPSTQHVLVVGVASTLTTLSTQTTRLVRLPLSVTRSEAITI